MRTDSYGQDSNNASGGWNNTPDPNAPVRFRSRHRAGQRVRGRIRRILSDEMAVIEVGGEELTASIQTTGSSAGTSLLFEIVELSPRIRLRALNPGSGGTQGDVTTILRRLHEARVGLSRSSSAPAHNTSLLFESPTAPQAWFAELLNHPERLEAHCEVQECLWLLNSALGPMGVQLFHVPWCAPYATGCDLLTYQPPDSGVTRVLFEMLHPVLGMVQARAMQRDDRVSFRLVLEHLPDDPAKHRQFEDELHTFCALPSDNASPKVCLLGTSRWTADRHPPLESLVGLTLTRGPQAALGTSLAG